MSSSNNAPVSPRSQLALSCFEELLDFAVADVASECHRIARLGLDRSVDAEEEELHVWAARVSGDHPGGDHAEDGAGCGIGGGGGSKGAVDVFGQTHPTIAADVVNCMNCGRPVVAGRFAPHLEKCMGKGRKARAKITRSSAAVRNRNNNGSAASSYYPYSNTTNVNRASIPNGTTDDGGSAGDEHSNHT